MRVLLIGDIVGKPGRQIVCRTLKPLIAREQLDLVIANGENAAGGSGITPGIFHELIAAGVDVVTLGDHIYRRAEVFDLLRTQPNVVKPANFPDEAPGSELAIVTARNGVKCGVFSLLGRVFMRPVDCPFKTADRIATRAKEQAAAVIVLDFHAEATSDKQLMGRYLDGRVSAVLGTHTHVPTADECIYPHGTAFQCDVGMTGPYESILGRQIERVMETTLTFMPTAFDVASGDVRLSGTIVDVDPETGRATAIRRIVVRESEFN